MIRICHLDPVMSEVIGCFSAVSFIQIGKPHKVSSIVCISSANSINTDGTNAASSSAQEYDFVFHGTLPDPSLLSPVISLFFISKFCCRSRRILSR